MGRPKTLDTKSDKTRPYGGSRSDTPLSPTSENKSVSSPSEKKRRRGSLASSGESDTSDDQPQLSKKALERRKSEIFESLLGGDKPKKISFHDLKETPRKTSVCE